MAAQVALRRQQEQDEALGIAPSGRSDEGVPVGVAVRLQQQSDNSKQRSSSNTRGSLSPSSNSIKSASAASMMMDSTRHLQVESPESVYEDASCKSLRKNLLLFFNMELCALLFLFGILQNIKKLHCSLN